MNANISLIRGTYEGSSEENGKNLLAVLSPDIVWTEAEGFPYAGTYHGIEALMNGVFRRLGSEWIGYKAEVHSYLGEGDQVVAFGIYSGVYRATGKSMTAHFAHLYKIANGQIVQLQQYVDSAKVREAMI